MKIENNKVVEATELELFDLFIKQEQYYFMPFKRYLELMKNDGCALIEGNKHELFIKKVKLMLSLPRKLLGAQIRYLRAKRK